MIKFILLILLCFGAYTALCVFAPSTWAPAFRISGHGIPYLALGVCLCGYVGYKAIK